MKRNVLFLVAMISMLIGVSPAFAIGEYSVGYRMGILTKLSTKFAIGSGEGQLLLGKESSPLDSVNPWHFSCSRSMASKVASYQGQYVWVKYQQHRINTFSVRSTEYEVLEIQPVSPNYLKSPSLAVGAPLKIGRQGVRTGRLVKVTEKGTAIKTFEVTLQMGNAGNQFQNMSITDSALYKYAINCLQSGKLMNVTYVDQMVNTNLSDTSYIIYKIGKVIELQ